jgi:hypothetical protein
MFASIVAAPFGCVNAREDEWFMTSPLEELATWSQSLSTEHQSDLGAMILLFLPGVQIDANIANEPLAGVLSWMAAEIPEPYGLQVIGRALLLRELIARAIRTRGTPEAWERARRVTDDLRVELEASARFAMSDTVAKSRDEFPRREAEWLETAHAWAEFTAKHLTDEALDQYEEKWRRHL